MEIVVATSIFATVVAAILALFVFVLRINREVQGVRQLSQGMRTFSETLVREIRNGRISYEVYDECSVNGAYNSKPNQFLSLVTYLGDKECIYLSGSDLYIFKNGVRQKINPVNFSVKSDSFQFIVNPSEDPKVTLAGYQPMVTILAEFVVNQGSGNEQIIPYQSTISSDIYDSSVVPPKN